MFTRVFQVAICGFPIRHRRFLTWWETGSLLKYVLSTLGVSKESISKFLIGNKFHV